MSIYRRVLRYYRPFLAQTILGLVLSLCGIALNLLKPWPLKVIVDQIIPSFARGDRSLHFYGADFFGAKSPAFSAPALVALLCGALVVISLAWGIINWVTNYIFVKVGMQALL